MTSYEYIVLLLALFGIKHFVADFLLQTPHMLAQKGTYGAAGGIEHAATHALGTLIVLVLVFPWNIGAHVFAIMLAAFDGFIHYHIDWAKTNLSKGLNPADRIFWIWFGADQGLHYLTYVAIIGIIAVA